jgi:hypothetical protein
MKIVTLNFERLIPMYGNRDPKTGWLSSDPTGMDCEVDTAYRHTWVVEDRGTAVRRRVAVVRRYTVLLTGERWYERGKYTTWEAAPGVNTDICVYCGYDNGPQGEGRQGWDCGMCGGN